MHVAQIKFRFQSSERAEEKTNALYALLGAWLRNGNILGRDLPVAIQSPRTWTAIVGVPDIRAFEKKTFNPYVRRQLKLLKLLGLGEPEYKIMGPDLSSASECKCRLRESCILYTNFLSADSPVRCGECFGTLALYHFSKLRSADCQAIISWQASYQACDQLNMSCGSGETFGSEQMSRYQSDLSKQGRKICRGLERSIQSAVYYYLYRNESKNLQIELKRRCPSCGGKWLLAEKWHGLFDFKCDRCRVLSNIAWNVAA